MDGLEFATGWWQDVEILRAKVYALYGKLRARGRSDIYTATKKKIYAERGWEPSRHLIEKNFNASLRQLEYFYVPKGFAPGPMFVFPQHDVEDLYRRAQTKPLYEIPNSDGKSSKYRVIGVKKDEFIGPVWLGNDDASLELIITKKYVVLVEGPFDLLAVRLLCPEIPSLCPLTKNVGRDHQAYLRMLGVKTLYLLFDNEVGQPDDEGQRCEGAGNAAMRRLQKDIQTMKVEILLCPGASDPSDCLTYPFNAVTLRSMLRTLVEMESW